MKTNRTKYFRFFIVLTALVMVGSMTQGVTAQIVADWFVDGATGSDNNPGQSWGQAFATPQKALLNGQLEAGHVIFVAAGTYYPDEINGGDSDDREDTFSLVNGVAVYGGFLNGDAFEDRDPEFNITILSGDIDQNDGPGEFENNDNNSFHVVTADGVGLTTIIYGFTITAGNADGPCPFCHGEIAGENQIGGGMVVLDASPIVFRCAIIPPPNWAA